LLMPQFAYQTVRHLLSGHAECFPDIYWTKGIEDQPSSSNRKLRLIPEFQRHSQERPQYHD
jgi:hypothetical protein